MSHHLFTIKSRNTKTGPIPVTTSDRNTCPNTCPLINAGCYASNSHLGVLWDKLTRTPVGKPFKHGRATITPQSFDHLITVVESLPAGQLWRHNQAGDLPHKNGTIDTKALRALTRANAGKRGFTYTHHIPTPINAKAIKRANDKGFTINLSANNPTHADTLAALKIAPIVTLLPAETHGQKTIKSPAGRTIVVCPATYRDDITCKSCELCQRQRQTIVGFPAHGATKTKASHIAKG